MGFLQRRVILLAECREVAYLVVGGAPPGPQLSKATTI